MTAMSPPLLKQIMLLGTNAKLHHLPLLLKRLFGYNGVTMALWITVRANMKDLGADGTFHAVFPWTAGWKRGSARHIDGVIEVDGNKAWDYDPYRETVESQRSRLQEIPFLLAQIRTVNGILDFVGEFGLLGQYPSDEEVYREPVDAWLAEAQSLSHVLIVAHHARSLVAGDETSLRALREGIAFANPAATTMPKAELLTHADMFISARVSMGVRNCVPFMVPAKDFGGAHGLFRLLEATPSPLHFAYWRLSQMLSTRVPWLRCANPACGRLFEQADPRQQYCSAACSARMRQRRIRSKNARSEVAATDGNADGKPDSHDETSEIGS
jgi:hypothetical protein